MKNILKSIILIRLDDFYNVRNSGLKLTLALVIFKPTLSKKLNKISLNTFNSSHSMISLLLFKIY